ncbi:hypothetical protein D3C85_1923060 [compost metagenome]
MQQPAGFRGPFMMFKLELVLLSLRQIIVDNRHFILGEGTGFVRTDDAGRAERLNSR